MTELILSMSIWGTLGAFVLWSGASAMEVAFCRCLIGGVLIAAYLLVKKQKITITKNTVGIVLAGLFLVLNWFFLFKSFQLSSITVGNMSYYLQPIILIILGIFIYKEKVDFRSWVLILLSFIGVILTIDINQLHSSNMLLGVSFAVFAALLYSFVTIMMKKVDENFFKVIFIQLFVGCIFLFPFIEVQSIGYQIGGYLITIGVIHTVLAYILYYRAVQKTSILNISILSYIDPIVAILTDIVFFERSLNLLQISGIMITFVSAGLLVFYKRTEEI